MRLASAVGGIQHQVICAIEQSRGVDRTNLSATGRVGIQRDHGARIRYRIVGQSAARQRGPRGHCDRNDSRDLTMIDGAADPTLRNCDRRIDRHRDLQRTVAERIAGRDL